MQSCEQYLPEGMNTSFQANAASIANTDDIHRAIDEKLPLEAVVLRCDTSHALHVSLRGFDARIPRDEAVHPDISGSEREISVLSRVGKYICFRAVSAKIEDGVTRVELSRKSVQSDALEHIFSTLVPGDIIPVSVTHLAPFGAFADVGCGVTALLPLKRISVSRIRHPAERLSRGDKIFTAVSDIDREHRRLWLTQRELLGTWSENAALFCAGETVRGIVRAIADYGVFVELTPNLCGLADSFDGAKTGDSVSVFIKSITPARMKIKLRILEKLPPESIPPLSYFISDGRIGYWEYSPESCGKKLTTDFTFSP